MTPLSWLALAGFATLTALPSPATGRVAALADGGRLHTGAAPTPAVRAAVPSAVPLVGCGVVVVIVGVGWGVALALATAAVLGAGLVLTRDALVRRAERIRHRDLLAAVRVLAGEVAAGASPSAALGAAAATSAGATRLLGPAVEAAGRGGDAAGTLLGSDVRGVRALGAAWQLVASTGAALAEVVERVGADLAADATRRHAVAVALAGPRASALMVSGLPLIGIGLGAAMGARPLDLLLGDPIGHVLCCAGILLDVAGVLWIRAVVRRAERA